MYLCFKHPIFRGSTGLIQVVALYWKIRAYMAPLGPKLIRARLMDPENVVRLCLHHFHHLCAEWLSCADG